MDVPSKVGGATRGYELPRRVVSRKNDVIYNSINALTRQWLIRVKETNIHEYKHKHFGSVRQLPEVEDVRTLVLSTRV